MMGVLIAAIADFIVFDVGIKHGMRIVDAHLASAAVAVVILYLAKVRGPAVAAGRGGDIRLHVHLLIVSAIAVILRGAVLGLETNSWGWPPLVAIVPAIIATLITLIAGYRYSLATTTWKLGSGDHWRVAVM